MKPATLRKPVTKPKPAAKRAASAPAATPSTQRGISLRTLAATSSSRKPGVTKPSSPAKPPVKTLDEQKTDFTSEGAPPPGNVASARHGSVAPALPADVQSPTSISAEPFVTPKSKRMKQAQADLAMGRVDTDRGPEVGRTYQKLKTPAVPPARGARGK